MMTDEELLEQYRTNQDYSAFSELYNRHKDEVVRVVRRNLRNDVHAAEDVVQETFCKIHIYADSFHRERRFKNWLFSIAHRVSIDHLRYAKRRPVCSMSDFVDEGKDFDPQNNRSDGMDSETAEQIEAMQSALTELPEEDQQILHLMYTEGRPSREAARIMGMTSKTLRSRACRARQRLAGKLVA